MKQIGGGYNGNRKEREILQLSWNPSFVNTTINQVFRIKILHYM